jgi:hypothetical protein
VIYEQLTMPWMKEFNCTEMQLICDDLTVEGLG